MLLGQLRALRAIEADRADEYGEAELESRVGVQIEFETFADAELLASRLADERYHMELSNVRVQADGSVRAAVWVPQGALLAFEGKIRAYIAESRRDFRTLIDAIQSIRAATFDALWTDDDSVLPTDDGQAVWWEVWLSNSARRRGLLDDFRRVVRSMHLELGGPELQFPERVVILVKCSRIQLQQPLLLCLCACLIPA